MSTTKIKKLLDFLVPPKINGVAIVQPSAPIVVADTAARKLLATYDPAPYMGMRVVQTDQLVSGLPTLLWMLMGTDVTDDDNWFGSVLSNSAGELVADLRLADFLGTTADFVPPLNALGHVGPRLSLGDGAKIHGHQMALLSDARYVPDGMVFARSIKTSNIASVVRHDGTGGATGICYSVNGGAAVYGSVAADTDITLSIPHAGGAPVDFYIWPASSATSGKLGNLTRFTCASQMLTSFDHAGLGALTHLTLNANLLPAFSGAGLGAVTDLYLASNLLYTFGNTGMGSLNILNIASNFISSCDLPGFSTNVGNPEGLAGLEAGYNNLDGPTLNAMYASMSAGTGWIDVEGNPGTSTDNPAIATAKGYTVVGS